ncbi:MAG: sarcosine oxidase subunit delta [Alphaproteobacteria bacterium]
MLAIPCPCCGMRPHSEFTYDGDASIKPLDYSALETPPEIAAAYVYDRKNIMGDIDEYWQHSSGCRQWLVVTRNSQTHQIKDAVLLSDLKR